MCRFFVVLYSWTVEGNRPTIDTQQNITQTSTSLSNGILTASFTRAIISSDKSHDLDLNVYRNVWWAYSGIVNDLSPFQVSSPVNFGYFNIQICINNCQDISVLNMSMYYNNNDTTGNYAYYL